MKALSGFYYVEDAQGIITECKARGRFRKEGMTPLVGDLVTMTKQNGKGVLEEILPRKNQFLRPAIANLELLVVFASEAIPVTEPFLIDRICAIAGSQSVEVLLCINKCDLASGTHLAEIYESSGFRVLRTSAKTGEGIEALAAALRGRLCCFTGNSGVGKSSILNSLHAELHLPTGEVSEKLGRGKHTTRHVELYHLPDGTLIADTPGFSSFDTERMELVRKEDLQDAFGEFAPYFGKCRFPDCAHEEEPGCAVRQALAEGKLQPTRYESYLRLYRHAKEIKTWEL